jgi:hypothetical protein
MDGTRGSLNAFLPIAGDGHLWSEIALCPRDNSYPCAIRRTHVLAGERFDSHGFIGIFLLFAGHLAEIRLDPQPTIREGG